MAYWVDDNMDTWPETFEAGTAAMGLYTRCGAYCARNTTDGRIPLGVATSYGTREWIAKLVEVGLWKVEGTGYMDVYYLVAPNGSKLNPAKVEVDRTRALARERQARKRGKGKPNPVPRDAPRDDRVNHDDRHAENHAVPTPVPSLPPSSKEEGRDVLTPARPEAALTAAEAEPPYDRPALHARLADARTHHRTRVNARTDGSYDRLLALAPNPEQEQAA